MRAEVSWLGVVARRRLPGALLSEGASGGSRGLAAYSCGGSAGLTPASLSRREATLARPPSYRQRARLSERPVAGTPDPSTPISGAGGSP